MKHKFSLIIPFLAFGVTGCNLTNPYATPKKKIKYSFTDTSKLEKINSSSMMYIANEAFANIAKLSSHEDISYYHQSGDIVEKSSVSFANLLFEENDKTDYVYCKGELFEDNVYESVSEYRNYSESDPSFNYYCKEETTQFFKAEEENPDHLRFYVNSKQKIKTETEKDEFEGTYPIKNMSTTAGNELHKFLDRILNSIDLEPFSTIDSMDVGKFFGKDKKGNYYAIFDYQETYSEEDIFDKYHTDFSEMNTHAEYKFENKDGSLYLTSYLSVSSYKYLRDLDGKFFDEPVLAYEYIDKSNFSYETKKSAAEHGSTELLSNDLGAYDFILYEYGDEFLPGDEFKSIGYFYPESSVYNVGRFSTSAGCYLLAKADEFDETSAVDIEIVPGSTPYVKIVGDTEYKVLEFTQDGFYAYGTRYDKDSNKLILRIYYEGSY